MEDRINGVMAMFYVLHTIHILPTILFSSPEVPGWRFQGKKKKHKEADNLTMVV